MQIHFDPGFSSLSRPNFSEIPQPSSSRGISAMPSSISWRMGANASEGGVCSWLTDFIHRICQFLGLASSSTSETSTVGETPLETRIAQGKQILDDHFQQDFIRNANSHHSAIIVVMKYNGQHKVSYARALSQKNNLDVIKAQLRELLTREESGHNDSSMLEIETLLFEKNNATFNFSHIDCRLRFSDGSRGGGPGHGTNLNRAAIYNQLTRATPGADRHSVIAFVINQL